MDKDKPHFLDFIWLFVIGSLGGFLIETFWHLVKYHNMINKQGLLYGPFKPIYGFGLVIMILLMYRFKNKNILFKFILGFFIGSIFEYLGSLFQEIFFGTSTWSYATFNFNLNGRVYLPYCFLWGGLAIICLDFLYPWLKKIIKKVYSKAYVIVTLIVGLVMILNIFLTAIATVRYSARANNQVKTNYVLKLIDNKYNDEYMQKKFPKLKIILK